MTWPLVHENDDGIRPAGKPDECFYCLQKVGQPHKLDCVCVKKLVEFKVDVHVSDGVKFAGLWQHEEPHNWDDRAMEFYKNESSWCANNFMDEENKGSVVWEGGEDRWPTLKAMHDDTSCCLCEALSFTLVRVVDPEPRRALREEKT